MPWADSQQGCSKPGDVVEELRRLLAETRLVAAVTDQERQQLGHERQLLEKQRQQQQAWLRQQEQQLQWQLKLQLQLEQERHRLQEMLSQQVKQPHEQKQRLEEHQDDQQHTKEQQLLEVVEEDKDEDVELTQEARASEDVILVLPVLPPDGPPSMPPATTLANPPAREAGRLGVAQLPTPGRLQGFGSESAPESSCPDEVTQLPTCLLDQLVGKEQDVCRDELAKRSSTAADVWPKLSFQRPSAAQEEDGCMWEVEIHWAGDDPQQRRSVSRLEVQVSVATDADVAAELFCRPGAGFLAGMSGDVLLSAPAPASSAGGAEGRGGRRLLSQFLPAHLGNTLQPMHVRLRGLPLGVALVVELTAFSRVEGRWEGRPSSPWLLAKLPSSMTADEMLVTKIVRDPNWGAGYRICDRTLRITDVDPSRAATSGIRVMDKVTGIGGQAVTSYEEYKALAYEACEFSLVLHHLALPPLEVLSTRFRQMAEQLLGERSAGGGSADGIATRVLEAFAAAPPVMWFSRDLP